MITIKRINEANKADINIKNEPFALFGKMIPLYDGREWSFRTEEFPEAERTEMIFPDENYDFAAMKDYFFIGAYDGDECIGLGIYKKEWFKYLYLEDLKVNRRYRKHGVGKLITEEGMKLSHELGLRGVYVVAQDNNLAACKFYISDGYRIGGFNSEVYKGTSQENKKDIYFYKDCE